VELPWLRLLSAFIVGGLLSLMGSLCQWTTENKLASPSTLGFEALAVAFVLFFQGLTWMGFFLPTPLVFFILIGISFLLSYFLSRFSHFQFSSKFLLLGLAINLLMGVGFALLQFLAMAYGLEFPNYLWFGQLHTPTSVELGYLVIVVTTIAMILIKNLKSFLSLGLGPNMALTFYAPLPRLWRNAILICFLGTIISVKIFGVFSFMGLIFPPLLRSLPFIQGKPRMEMTWGAFLAGFIFMMLDLLCYFFPLSGAEIPVGLVSSTLGALGLVFITTKQILVSK
jgi:iron complex transport system permease protein